MKRNMYFILLVLSILSACQPRPGGQGQTVNNEPSSTFTPITLPMRPDIEGNDGVAYSDSQIQQINSGAFVEQEDPLADRIYDYYTTTR